MVGQGSLTIIAAFVIAQKASLNGDPDYQCLYLTTTS